MSSVAISGNAGGTGVFTIASPSSSSSYTATLPTATTTLVGTDATQTLTNKTIDGSQLVAGSVTNTQLATASQSLGSGQTWQDLTASRAGGTTYTNSTGRPIALGISVTNASPATTSAAQLTIGGVIVSFPGEQANRRSALFGIVPPSTTYSLSLSSDTIQYWTELR
jgi:hypothetical protein